ncbi:MAG: amino acid adenylation domain-containing protein [Acidobacteriota bacterium]
MNLDDTVPRGTTPDLKASAPEPKAAVTRSSEGSSTLLQRLTHVAELRPQQRAFAFLGDGSEIEEELSYGELRQRVEAQARALVRIGAGGERVLLLLPPGLGYVVALLACFAAGAVAVPAYPPRHRRTLPRLRAVVEDAEARFVIADEGVQRRAEGVAPGLAWISPAELDEGREGELPTPGDDHLAFLQYTSGSTGTPKGVMLRHRHLMANQRMIQQAFGTTPDDIVVSWLPLYHDMGLIGGVFHPLYLGTSCILLSPQRFLQRPLRWLEAIEHWGGTVSGAPDFAYDLCVRKSTPEQRAALDLSAWRVAFNGAEPVRAKTLRRFAEAFAGSGFQSGAFRPCYGLAEATLLVTGGASSVAAAGSVTSLPVDSGALSQHRIEVVEEAAPDASELVSSGIAGEDAQLVVVDPGSLEAGTPRPAAADRVGEVWVAGPAVADGYWRRPEVTAQTFGAHLEDGRGPFLRTGDLGFVTAEGDLYVTGRLKDLIILRGRNLYPQDLEESAEESHPMLRPGGAAAFAISLEDGSEGLAMVAELEVRRGADHEAVIAALRRRVAEDHEAAVQRVALLRPGGLPRTSSGKVRRRSARQGLLDGTLETLATWTLGEEERGDGERENRRPPQTDLEKRLAQWWSEVLGVGQVAATDAFFQLGGDSLTATELMARISRELGAELELDVLFDHPTVEELAAHLEGVVAEVGQRREGADVLAESDQAEPGQADSVQAGPGQADPAQAEEGGENPLSFPQQQLWFLHQLDPENPVHQVAAEVDLRGVVDAGCWRRALESVILRHGALRTRFGISESTSGAVQRALSAQQLQESGALRGLLPQVDLSALDESQRSSVAASLTRAWARRPFDLGRPPLLRALLLTLNDGVQREGGAADSEIQGRLVLVAHHIACDGWSLGLLLDDWLAAYRGLAAGPLESSYATFARRQRQAAESAAWASDLEALQQRLAEIQPTELPTDRPRPPVLSHRGAHWVCPLPQAAVERWSAVAAQQRATPFMAQLTIFAGLLERWTDRRDALVGTPVAGREDGPWGQLVGCFINLLPLPLASFEVADHETTGREALSAVRRDAASAYSHRRLPFEQLVRALGRRPDPSRTPLFQILFVQQNAPMTTVRLPQLTVSPRELDLGTARYDLAVNIARTDDGPVAIWKYATDLYDAATIQRLAEGYRRLLSAAAETPDASLAALPLLSDAEAHQLRVELNDSQRPLLAPHAPDSRLDDSSAPSAALTADLTLGDLLRFAAEHHPEVPAVIDSDDSSITYAELLHRSVLLAQRLRAAGAGPERPVGVLLHREGVRVEALFAVLLAGAAYVPLSFEYPESRRRILMSDSRLELVVTREALRDEVPSSLRVVTVDGEEAAAGTLDSMSSAAELPAVSPDSLAYIIYTSGTTGRPKGVMVSHRAVVNRLLWTQEHFPLLPAEAVLHKTPFGFDVSVWELFWPTTAAATMVIAEDGRHGDTAYLARRIQQRQVTTVHFVPSMLQAFVEEPAALGCGSLRRVLASGEALPGELAARFASTIGRETEAQLHNLYGPTEAAVDVTYAAAPRDPQQAAARPSVPIGHPVANTTVDLLDASFRLAPLGAAGEVALGGIQLARGYFHRPSLTADRFRPDPWAGHGGRPSGARVYRTGDLARRLVDGGAGIAPGGAVEYLGRLDHQVKVRGVRIELGEVRAALIALEGVKEAEVLARPGVGGGLELVAYLVSQPDVPESALTPESFAAALNQRLPGPMVPSAYGLVWALPLTTNGKVDRRALAAMPAHRPGAAAQERKASRAHNAVERHLAELWREVLDLPEGRLPEPEEDFFALGGDSVRGALMINRLQVALGETLYVMTLFDAPRLEALAAHLGERFPTAVARWTGASLAAGEEDPEARSGAEEDEVSVVRSAVTSRWRQPEHFDALLSGPAPAAALGRRPALHRPVVILSPFRSGSTLLRVMLAGHPELFSPPELELLHFDTLEERAQAFSGRDAFSGEGLTRAMMDLYQLAAGGARRLEEQWREEGLSVAQVYRRLEAASGERRLVDKTPSYALSAATLAKTEQLFEEPVYIHLLRHPQAVIHSFVAASMDQVYRFGPSPEHQGEACWVLAQRNILQLRQRVPADRWVELSFEELVQDPEAAMEGLCRALGLGYHSALLEPYSPGRMTDGLKSGEGGDRMMGDPRFHRHRRIEASVAHRWRQEEPAPLGSPARALADRLGYGERPSPAPPAAPEEWREAPLGPTQERLWFLSRLLPRASVAYHMPARLRLRGRLQVPALAAAFQELVYRHGALRSALPERRGRAVQRIAPVASSAALVPLPVVDLGGLDGDGGELPQDLAQRFARRSFDLGRGPLLRLALLRHPGGEAHDLLVGLHHVAADGWSLGLIVRELGVLYRQHWTDHQEGADQEEGLHLEGGGSADQGGELAPVPLHFADFARWQRRWVLGPEAAADLEVWKERLQGAPTALELPADRPRPAVASYRGDRRSARWSHQLRSEVEALARELRTTPFAILTTAYGALLSRFAGGAGEVVVGTPVAGREDDRLEAAVGCFVNTLPLRLGLPAEQGFAAAVAASSATVADALSRQRLPFDTLVDALAPDRSLAQAPIFQVLLVLQNQPMPRLELPQLELVTEELTTGAAKLDLTLSVAPPRTDSAAEGQSWEATLDFATDLFDATTAARWLAALQRFLVAAVADPASPLGALPLASPAEQHQLLVEANDTAALPVHQGLDPKASTLAELVASGLDRAVRRDPRRTLLVDDGSGEELNAGQLRNRVNLLAAALRQRGAGPETRVAVALPRGADLVVTLLAVVQAGAAYVPLDPELPADRLAWLAEDAAAAAWVMPKGANSAQLFAAEPGDGARPAVLHPEDFPASLSPSEERFPAATDESAVGQIPAQLAPTHPAYVLYTSGSTGRPKGVAVPHEGIVNRLRWMQRAFPLGEGDAVLQKTPMSFDVSVWEFFWAFAAGAQLVVARPGGHRDPRYLASVMERRQVTVAHFVPSMLELFLEPADLRPPRRLRQVVASGEALPPELVRRFHRRLPGTLLANLYGPTEASVDVTWHRCRRRPQIVPIGRAVDNVRLAVLGRDGRAAAPGAAGELLLGGVQLARGYHRQPQRTAAAFVPDPWAGTPYGGPPGARLYRTGDLVRLVPGGEVEYLGRIDFQVKVRGVRVELGEVEGALRRLEGVREAVVLLRKDGQGAGSGRLAAYVTAELADGAEDAAESGSRLRQRLAAELPEAMVPAAVVVLESLPLSSNGKVDRRALAELPAPWRQQGESLAALRGRDEGKIAEIWCELLGLERVGAEQSFFDVGGNSLLAMRLRARLEEAFRRGVETVDLFQHPTVRAQALLLGSSSAEEQASAPRAAAESVAPKARAAEPSEVVEAAGRGVVEPRREAETVAVGVTAEGRADEGRADEGRAEDGRAARRRRRQRLKDKAGSRA